MLYIMLLSELGVAMLEAYRWALNYSTGTQMEFWGPRVLPLLGFLITLYLTSPGAPKTSQMGLYIP